MSTRVQVTLTLNQAEYIQDLIDDDMEAGGEVDAAAHGAARKLRRAVNAVVQIQAKRQAEELSMPPGQRPGGDA